LGGGKLPAARRASSVSLVYDRATLFPPHPGQGQESFLKSPPPPLGQYLGHLKVDPCLPSPPSSPFILPSVQPWNSK
ncbi:hypothetical protein KUCAC02_001864, partial [Chaenocephalus aceratus]